MFVAPEKVAQRMQITPTMFETKESLILIEKNCFNVHGFVCNVYDKVARYVFLFYFVLICKYAYLKVCVHKQILNRDKYNIHRKN